MQHNHSLQLSTGVSGSEDSTIRSRAKPKPIWPSIRNDRTPRSILAGVFRRCWSRGFLRLSV